MDLPSLVDRRAAGSRQAGQRQPPVTGTVPGPRGGALLGSLRDLRRDQLATFVSGMNDHGGEVVRFVAGPPGMRRTLYLVAHPDGVQQVLATSSRNYVKGSPFYRELRAWLGDGLLTSEGEEWQRQRRTVQPLFTPRRVRNYVDVMAGESARLLDELVPVAATGGSVDLHSASMRYALRVVGRLLFGDAVDDAVATIHRAFPVVDAHVRARGMAPVRLPRGAPTPGTRRAVAAQRDLHRVVDDIVSRRRPDSGRQDLVTLLQQARDPHTGRGLDPTEVRDQLLVFLLAGHETTANALTFAFHLIGSHPDVQQRLRAEADDVLGAAPGGVPTAVDLERLPYAGMVLAEALRLYPPAPGTGRLAVEPDTVLGHRLDAGAIVVVSIWATHRHPRFWDRPEEFDPERFAPDQAARRHRYAYLPFGGGPRACIGALFARLEATVALATVVRALRLRTPAVRPAVSAGVTLRPQGPVPCRLSLAGRGPA